MKKTAKKPSPESSAFSRADAYLSNRVRSMISGFARDLHRTWRLTQLHDLPILASSLAFFCLFSVVPFLILSFIGASHLIGQNALPPREIAGFFETLVPHLAPWITAAMISVLNRNIVGDLFGVVLLATSAYGLFSCLHTIFARISVGGRRRDFIGSSLVALCCFSIAMMAMTLLVFLFTTQPQKLQSLLAQYLPNVDVSTVALGAPVIALAAVALSIATVYKLLPLRPVRWVHAFRGSVLFLFLFYLGRIGYETYVRFYALLNENTYGSFFTLILVFVWLYYLCSAFIFSAQYAIGLEERARVDRMADIP